MPPTSRPPQADAESRVAELSSTSTTGDPTGRRLIDAGSPLTRLNYFDGKFLRAADLRLEQDYLRRLVWLSNQGLGWGVVYGLDGALTGRGQLHIGGGLAIDGQGRVLLLESAKTVDIIEVIDAGRRARRAAAQSRVAGVRPAGARVASASVFGNCIDDETTDDVVVEATELYVICVGHAQDVCGEEDVYGKLCEQACVTSSDRPYAVEGIIVRALPLALRTPLARSTAVALDSRHLRSRVASAYFADERLDVASLISRDGLMRDVWCLGAEYSARGCVPIGVVARAGARVLFFDAWTSRRERIEAPAQRYWAWRMAMRPWDVYLAHILQFQCQLHEVLQGTPDGGSGDDPCRGQGDVLEEAQKFVLDIEESFLGQVERLARSGDRTLPRELLFQPPGGMAGLTALRARLLASLKATGNAQRRVLINGGIIELPSAGYLPVVPSSTVSINTQVRRLLGEGLDLRFCVVRPDFVPHALEEAQHMDRISLLQGLDDPANKPDVDILVPNGEIRKAEQPTLDGWDSRLSLNVGERQDDVGGGRAPVTLHGAGRSERLAGGGAAFHFAGAQEVPDPARFIRFVRDVATLNVANLEERERVLRRIPIAEAEGVEREIRARIDSNVVSRISVAGLRPAADVGADVKPVATGWVSMRVESNPFDLAVAQPTPVALEIVISLMKGERRVLMRAQVNGSFRVAQLALPSPDTRRVRGHISGLRRLTTHIGDTVAANETEPLEVDVELVLTGDASEGTFLLTTGGDPERRRLGYRLEAKWKGSPTEAVLQLSGGLLRDGVFENAAGRAPQPLATARVVRDTQALVIGGELRALSTSAIEALGREIGAPDGPGFSDAAARMLFPPPPPPTEELTVRGTMDWVLFHRRRTKRCGVDVQAPPPPRAGRYQVFHYRMKEPAELEAIQKALRTATDITQFNFERIAVAEYVPAQATLLSDIGGDWTQHAPGNTLAYGAIATKGEEDSPSLEQARLTRLIGTLAPATVPDPTARVEALDAVPTALEVPGTDGMIFLVTQQVVRTECQRVFGVTTMDNWQRVRKILTLATAAEIDEAMRNLVNEIVFELGRPRFDVATGAVTPPPPLADLKGTWDATPQLKGRIVGHRALWPSPNDADGQRHELESGAVEGAFPLSQNITRETVKTTVAPVDVQLGEPDASKRCPVVTFLVATALPVFVARFVAARRVTDQTGAVTQHVAIPNTRQPTWKLDPQGQAPASDFQAEVAPDVRNTGLAPYDLVELATRDDPATDVVQRRLTLVFEELRKANVLRQNAQPRAVRLTPQDEHFLKDETPVANEVVFLGLQG